MPPATPIATGLLEGVWDVTGSTPGSALVTGVVEISATRFHVEFQPSSLTMTIDANGSILTAWAEDAFTGTDITTTRAPIAFDTGAIPLPLGGMWAFTSPMANDTTQCTGNLSPTAFQGGCNKSVSVPGGFPSLRGSAQANKTTVLPSSFGDFGGRWEFTGDSSGCTATFEQSTASWKCPIPGKGFGGQATIEFTDTTASGTSSEGLQFSALKR